MIYTCVILKNMRMAQPGPSSTVVKSEGGGSEGIWICTTNTGGTCRWCVSTASSSAGT